MPNKMLIDASHPEETRVVVTRGNRIEEFDFESQDKKQLKGNIYLARVTRVEPSLQAAFVEYGGNRHGFLAFSEIHPDYYQIPVADRQALLRAEAEDAENEDDDEAETEERGERGRGRRRRRGGRNRGRDERQAVGADGDTEASDVETTEDEAADTDSAAETDADGQIAADADGAVAKGDAEQGGVEPDADTGEELVHEASAHVDERADEAAERVADDGAGVAARNADDEAPADAGRLADAETSEGATTTRPGSMAAAVDADVVSESVEVVSEELKGTPAEEAVATEGEDRGTVEEVPSSHADDSEVESVGAEDALEEIRNRRRPVRRNYKIQEVIKRRQILLVQVVKEERGNKGAALTTYLSLAGRYSVLMPNTARGGGISRKITNAVDRKRLKEVVADLDVPQGMGVILRTAGESRTKAEIKRDYEYLMRLWETVRNLTLQSTAPALVYEEGSLIKRSVRDLYNKDIDEILVSGEEGYREAKDFMRMLMPSHAKVVQPYRDTVPIFARAGIEPQLDRMLQPQVTLKSGGYIIINQTEALVSIDVNSGRSTKEHSIEDTALQTNLEAAEEVARQLRLRDLAGLIVIDFIDMEENRNNRSVEKRLKDCLKNDRARIQVGRISHFGLLEMSRQRIRASVLESTMKPCPHCGGAGHVRSDSSVALHVVRAIEEFLLKDSRNHITVKTPTATALYVLNHKRSTLVEMERRFGVTISLEADETLGAQPYAILRGAFAEKPISTPAEQAPALAAPEEEEEEIEVDIAESLDEETSEPVAGERNGHGEPHHRDRKRRRRRKRRGGEREHDLHGAGEAGFDHDDAADSADEEASLNVEASEAVAEAGSAETAAGGERGEAGQKKRRRGKRGGRRNRPNDENGAAEESLEASAADATDEEPDDAVDAVAADVEAAAVDIEQYSDGEADVEPEHPVTAAGDEKAEPDAPAAKPDASPAEITASVVSNGEDDSAPVHRTRRRPGSDVETSSEPVVVSSAGTPEETKPKKGGWWQRKGFF